MRIESYAGRYGLEVTATDYLLKVWSSKLITDAEMRDARAPILHTAMVEKVREEVALEVQGIRAAIQFMAEQGAYGLPYSEVQQAHAKVLRKAGLYVPKGQ